jgi:hypothetical protein
MPKGLKFVVAAIVGPLILVVLGFALYPSVARLEPAYKAAKATCDSIKSGMTYDQVKSRVGNFFVPPPATYLDDKGNGQVWLTNGVKHIDTNCRIEFKNGQVTSSAMVDVWL